LCKFPYRQYFPRAQYRSSMFGGGLKYDVSDRVGLRGQGRVWATTISTSGGFGGCSVGLGGYGVWSLEMSAGMYIKFGN